MLYLLNKDVRTVRWNGEPLHEATSAIVKETMNGDFTLTVKYPISDSGIYQLIQEDMLIKAPTPVLGAQLFRIKKPVEQNDHLEITAYHISDDVMQRSITPVSVTSQSCGMALSRMVQNTKTALGDFSFNSDIQDRRTFNTTETETLYSVLLDGKHSIVGTWEGELVRDNFALTVKKSRGENRGVVITTHKNLKDYQRTRNSQNVVTRIHAKSTFKPEGAEKETTIRVTVDSPLINSYPYINEKEYENNNSKSVEELQKWAQAKFSNEGIDKISDAIKIEAYELDGQVVHMGDTVNLKSWKHNVDAFKKAIAYEFDALKEEYISLTFDDKAGVGGSRASGGLSSAADAILGVTESAQEIALEKALQNADLDFDYKAGLLRQEISDGIELAKAKAEEVKRELSDNIDQRFSSFNNGPLQDAKRRAEEALRNAGASSLLAQEAKRIGLDSVSKLEEFKRQATSAQTALSDDLDALKRTVANDIRPKQAQAEAEISKQVEALVQTKKELAGIQSAQSTFEQSTTRRLSELTNLANGKASKSELTQTAEELASKIASVQIAHKNQGDRVSAVESSFKQRADALDVGVNRLTEGLRTKADISSLNVTAENIRQSVKSLETDTKNKLNQKLSLAEFEVRAGSIRQEILNATKDKADKTLVVAEAGKLREEFSKMRVGGRNYAEDYDFSRGLWRYHQGDSSPVDWKITNGEYHVKGTTKIWKQMQIFSKEGSQASGKNSTALLELEIGETYTLSFQGICYSGSPNVWISLRANRTAPGNPEIISGNFTLTSSWQTYQVTIPALTKPDNFDFWRIILGYNEIGHVAFRKVELTRSSTRTDAGPAPEDGKTDLVVAKSEFKKTADGLSAKMSAVESYVGQDSQRQEALRRYTREESARQATAVRELVTRDYVGKSTFQESIQGVERRLESYSLGISGNLLKNSNDGFRNQHAKRYILVETLQANQTYTLVTKYWHGEKSTGHTFLGGGGNWRHLTYNRAIDAWMVQFTPKENIPQGTELTLSSHPSDALGNMAWATLVQGHIPLTYWQPAKGDVEEGVTKKLAEYKETIDGRFANIVSQIADKASQADFQKVKETSQLYERILGNTENGIADKVARMALTNQLFQVEVSKAAKGGRNYIRNGQFKNGSKNWLEYQSVNFGLNFNYQHSQNPNNRNRPGLHFYHESQDVANFFGIQQSFAFDGVRGEKVSVSLLVSKDGGDSNSGLRVALHYIKNKDIIGQEWQSIPSPQITSKYKRFTFTFTLSDDVENLNLMLFGEKGKVINLYVTDVQVERGAVATDYKEAPEDTDEAIRSVQSQIAGSWSVQNLTSAGSIVSQINATNNQILIEAEKIRLKGKTLLDELTAIQGYFKRLFVGDASVGTLNSDIIRSNSITADKLVMDIAMARRFVSSDIFTDALAAKEAFINKLRSVVVTATLLEGYKGWIGGFQIGTHDSGSGRWLTGKNHFSVGMGDGEGDEGSTALWVNWGNRWDRVGDKAWYVKNNGQMFCYNRAEFWNTPVIHGDLRVTGSIYYNNRSAGGKAGYWISSEKYSHIEPSGGSLYLYYSGSGYDWIIMNKDVSDRRYKHNIESSTISGLDVVENLKTYSYRKEYDGKIEDISCGIMAQDVQKYAPEAFFENPDGAYSYNTFALVPYLIKAIQELNHKIEKLEKTA